MKLHAPPLHEIIHKLAIHREAIRQQRDACLSDINVDQSLSWLKGQWAKPGFPKKRKRKTASLRRRGVRKVLKPLLIRLWDSKPVPAKKTRDELLCLGLIDDEIDRIIKCTEFLPSHPRNQEYLDLIAEVDEHPLITVLLPKIETLGTVTDLIKLKNYARRIANGCPLGSYPTTEGYREEDISWIPPKLAQVDASGMTDELWSLLKRKHARVLRKAKLRPMRSRQVVKAQQIVTALGEGKRRLNDTERAIIKLCRKKFFKGQILANEVGISFDYGRKIFARLVKEKRLKNDSERGYRTM